MKMLCEFIPSSLKENREWLTAYLHSLSEPMDSWAEDNLDKCTIFSVIDRGTHIGFIGAQGQTLWFFYVDARYLWSAQDIFEEAVKSLDIKNVYLRTSDQLLVSLVMDWEFDKEKGAYFFQDGFQIERPDLSFDNIDFTQATLADLPYIQQETNNFFDESDIASATIFMLRTGEELLGCGISVLSRYHVGYASIGMVTCAKYRQQGVGKYILWSLKEWCYDQGLKPLAGCWYYNTLSRKTLESAGLVTRARGLKAILREKEIVPERTGNPPGELV